MTGDPLHTKLCDMLGIEFPVIAFTHCKDVAVAVINAGGFAVLGEAMHTPEDIEADVRWIRDRVEGRPFGIDLVLPASVPPAGSVDELMANIPETHRAFAEDIKQRYDVPDPKGKVDLHQWGGLNQELARAQLDVLLEERVPVIASGLGSPAFMLDAAHERGIKVFGLVGKARQAKRQLEAGVDAIIAQGYDAAGHTGNVGTLSIVAEVAAMAGDTPIIAAGGITTGRHLAAALCLGASGVWTGTLWLACRESDVDMIIKERILESTTDDTTFSSSISGMTMRVLKCPWTEEWAKPEAPDPLPAPYQMLLSSDYIQGANDNRRGDLMTEAAGQGVSFVTTMKPAKQILFDMVEEALDTFDGLCGDGS
jgi:NAD(P)H-dependent flavin oxidoreductase YrpB (nitropropane dioxygenase family)